MRAAVMTLCMLWCTRVLAQTVVDPDSIDTVTQVLENADERAATVAAPRPSERRYFRATVLSGYTNEFTYRLKTRWVDGGYRWIEGERRAYVSLHSRGFIERVTVGHMVLATGERVVLGRGFGVYSGSGSGAGPLAASPTLSTWRGSRGLAVAVRVGAWRGAVAALQRDGPETLWSDMSYVTPTFDVGVSLAYGRYRHTVVVHARRNVRALRLGVDVTRTRQRQYYLVARAATPSYGVALFQVPYKADDTAGPRLSGAHVWARTRLHVLRLRADLTTTIRDRGDPTRARRDIVVMASGPAARGASWTVSFRARITDEVELPASLVSPLLVINREKLMRWRLVLRVAGAGLLAHDLRVDVFHPRGRLLTFATSLVRRRFDLQWRVSAYDLDPGVRGYISRPGVGTREFFGAVAGRGSDISIRIRVHVFGGARGVMFAGQRPNGDVRFYLGAEWR